MPVTPYHFGPSGLVGLLFKRWLDLPVFLLANVVVDLEVLTIVVLELGYPVHRYCHTLLIGGVVGVVWGLIAYPLRGLWRGIMSAFQLPYEPTLGKAVLAGVLGVWAHVLIDATQHSDIRLFWPNTTFCLATYTRPYIDHYRLELVCVALFLLTLAVYAFPRTRTDRSTSGEGSPPPLV